MTAKAIAVIFILAVSTGLFNAIAQQTNDYRDTIRFDVSVLQEYLNQPAYQYGERVQKTSLIQSIWEQIRAWLREAFTGESAKLINTLILLLAGVTFGALIIYLLRNRYGGFLLRGNRKLNGAIRVFNEDVMASSLQNKIQYALAQGDFREAYRWTYLHMLIALRDKGLLRLRAYKTNRDYKHEMDGSVHSQSFIRLADVFDHTWYGDYPLTAESYRQYAGMADSISAYENRT